MTLSRSGADEHNWAEGVGSMENVAVSWEVKKEEQRRGMKGGNDALIPIRSTFY